MKTKDFEELKKEALKICEERCVIFPANKTSFVAGFIDGYMYGYQAMMEGAEKIISHLLKPSKPSFPDAETR